ncbi:unnamed protein product [Schistosoma intercalatum]|nr:unnamed protein product [Schistosoma intercalatum]
MLNKLNQYVQTCIDCEGADHEHLSKRQSIIAQSTLEIDLLTLRGSFESFALVLKTSFIILLLGRIKDFVKAYEQALILLFCTDV